MLYTDNYRTRQGRESLESLSGGKNEKQASGRNPRPSLQARAGVYSKIDNRIRRTKCPVPIAPFAGARPVALAVRVLARNFPLSLGRPTPSWLLFWKRKRKSSDRLESNLSPCVPRERREHTGDAFYPVCSRQSGLTESLNLSLRVYPQGLWINLWKKTGPKLLTLAPRLIRCPCPQQNREVLP